MSHSSIMRIIGGILCLVVAVLLATYTTDREFINLLPSPGTVHQVPLVHGTLYEQYFVAQRYSITRLGIFLKVLTAGTPTAAVSVQLYRGNQLIAAQSVSSIFIDSEGFTQVRFLPPVRTTPGEQLKFTVAVPSELSGHIAAQARAVDLSFEVDDVPLVIAGDSRSTPLAHQVYFSYRPPFALQLALLSLYATVLVFFAKLGTWQYSPALHALIISTAAIIPGLLHDSWPFLLHAALFVALYGMYVFLRASGVSVTAAWLGACVAALNSWWALHYLGGREKLFVVSLLPWAVYIAMTWRRSFPHRRWIVIGLFLLAAIFLATGSYQQPPQLEQQASLKDIFLDPYQVAFSEKVVGSALTWDHFGSYVGFIALLLAGVGILWRMKRFWVIAAVGVGALVVVQQSLYRIMFIPVPYFIILTTLTVAFFSAWGLEGLWRYLGHDKVGARVAQLIALVVLLDLLFVLATTLEAASLL